MFQTVKNAVHLIEGVCASVVHGFPAKELSILAITGTDGKTTSATLLYHILQSCKKNTALISTVAAYIGNEEIDTGFHVTTPTSFELQKLLSKIRAKNIEYVVMEVTSHGIDQNRVWGIFPTIAGITNVTHEHLDYHSSYDNYLETKAKILLRSKFSFINARAKESHKKLSHILKKNSAEYDSYDPQNVPTKVVKAIEKKFGKQNYNWENATLAYNIAKKIGCTDEAIAKAILTFAGVPVRMQSIPNHLHLKIIVDFAHTPNALQQALSSLQSPTSKKSRGKLIVVFGCAGLRDQSKRPMMGKVAATYADYVILTAEDPRTEDVESIILQIKSGITSGIEKILSIPDRYEAISYAIHTLAQAGDTIIVTGKGHEQSMCFGTTEYPWNDASTILRMLETTKHKKQV